VDALLLAAGHYGVKNAIGGVEPYTQPEVCKLLQLDEWYLQGFIKGCDGAKYREPYREPTRLQCLGTYNRGFKDGRLVRYKFKLRPIAEYYKDTVRAPD